MVRDFIPDTENNPTIYHGLPLHTEYRVFVDFNATDPFEQVLGISPYWEPKTMKSKSLVEKQMPFTDQILMAMILVLTMTRCRNSMMPSKMQRIHPFPMVRDCFLISKEKAGFTEWREPGSGNYWQALKEASMNYQSFGAADGNQDYDFVVAPAFNLDLSKIEIVGDEIMIKAMSAPLGNTILFENPDATSVQKQMFLHYGLYLEEKTERLKNMLLYIPEQNIFRKGFIFRQMISRQIVISNFIKIQKHLK